MRLRELRTALGWTQAQLAERCDLNQVIISDYELGKTQPRLATVVRLAEALGCSTDELLGVERGQSPRPTGAENLSPAGESGERDRKESGDGAPTPAGTSSREGGAMAQAPVAPGDADPLVLLARALTLLELREANDRHRTDQREETERQRIQQVDAVNAATLRKIVERLDASRMGGDPSDQGEQEA